MIIQDKTQKGTLPDNELDELLKFIQNNKWRDAFSKLNLPVFKSKKNWFTNSKRGAYYNELSVKRKEAVLDIGSGGGGYFTSP